MFDIGQIRGVTKKKPEFACHAYDSMTIGYPLMSMCSTTSHQYSAIILFTSRILFLSYKIFCSTHLLPCVTDLDVAKTWTKESIWNSWLSWESAQLSVSNFSRRFMENMWCQKRRSMNGTNGSKVAVRRWKMTTSQDGLPQQRLLITLTEWTSWYGVIVDWLCGWWQSTSAWKGNQCEPS